jgi:uncharacterized lipoprotein YmbA
MMIIGVDYHPSFQQIAFLDPDAGECGERRLNHSDGEAEKFCRDLQQRGICVRVGMEASGYSRWFERLLAELGFELWMGHAAEIKSRRVKKQKTDRKDAQLLLRLMREENFPVELRVVVHFTKGDDGSLKATMDSPDQGAKGIPVTSVSLKDSKLAFSVDSVNGSYEGKVNAEGTAIAGTWSQGQPLPLDFKRITTVARAEHKPAKPAKPAKPSDIDGTWLGSLDTGATKLRVAFHVTNTEDGLTATMDSLDQGAKGIPVTAVIRNGSSLKMELKGIGGTFEGKIDKAFTTIEGTWTQGAATLPLVLKRHSATTSD